jgi:uncharacterized protein YbjT (DUF2867 family)
MKVTVTGSLGNISRILTEKLIANGHIVTVVSSNPERSHEIEALGAIPLTGSVEDYGFLTRAFEGADAAYLMIPPNFSTADLKQYIKTVGGYYAKAIKKTGVKLVVNLSSIGSHLEAGLGPTGSNFSVEQKLNELPGVNVLHLRPGMFLTNFYGAIPMIRHQRMLGNNFDSAVSLPLTHPKDIAELAFNAIDQFAISGKIVQYVISDEKNGSEVAAALGQAIGEPGLNWVEFSDEQLLNALVQSGFSEQMATVYMVEIGIALRQGSFTEDYHKVNGKLVGSTTLAEFAKEFALAYQSPEQ